jgi:ABC-type bacteriocin/lantibiotic exporter with double-glycine peptidase domain
LKRDGDEIVYRPESIEVVLDRMQQLSHYEDDVIIVVPSHLQMDSFSCGPIAVWSLVKTFHGTRYSLDQVCKACDYDQDGMDQYAIRQALKKLHIGCSFRNNLTFERIGRIIDQGFPIIAGIGRDWEHEHWAVIYAYGKNPNRLSLANCLGENQGESREEFEWSEFKGTWASKGFGIVCWGK